MLVSTQAQRFHVIIVIIFCVGLKEQALLDKLGYYWKLWKLLVIA